MMYRVLITGAIDPVGVEMLRQEPDLEVDYQPDLPMPRILEIIPNYHGLVTRSETPVKRELIDRASQLKVIARAAVGVADIDVEYATQKGILVMNTPGKNTNSAAELTIGLLLAVVRKINLAHDSMRQLQWNRHRFTGTELLGKTLGVIGLGNVGHRVARFALGFEMRVLAYDPYIPDEVFVRNRVEKVDLETLVAESDVITVHTPKNKETTGMIGAAQIANMRPGVIILNAARGGIIDDAALQAAIESGHVAGAGIDTWMVEPPKENPLRDLPTVVMTPHIGASTVEAQRRVAETIAQQLPRALRGGVVEYPVNMPQIRTLEGDALTSYTVLAEKLGMCAAQFMDFKPQALEMAFRGSIAKQDCTLLRLAFLKGYMMNAHEYVSYVNAELRATSIGLQISNTVDPSFTDFESALECVFRAEGQRFTIGGVVFAGPHPRITLLDDFRFEVEPEGHFIAIRSKDRLGVVSGIASLLDRHQLQIKTFAFSHSGTKKRSMFLLRVGKQPTDTLVDELRQQPHITMVRSISL